MGGVSVPEELVRKVDVKFMQDMVGEKNCVSVELLDFSNQGGLSCDMFLIRSEHGDPSSDAALEVKTRVLKTFIGEGQLQKSSLFGLAREGLFMKAMNEKSTEGKRDAIKSLIPTVYYSEGDMATGEKLMIMEKMEGTQTGLLYTDKYHLCLWQKEESELAKIREEFGDNMSQFDVCKESFEMAAKLHASYWMDGEVLSKWEFLRGRGVIAPKDGDDWVDPLWKASQDDAMKGWSKVNELILDVQAKNGESHQFSEDMEFKDYESKMEFSQVDAIKMDPHLVRCVNESLSKIDFKEYCKIFGSGDNGSYPWSLVHGDFFPGNVLCCKGNGADKASAGNRFLKLVDFEMVGLGSGPQDLGQYMISNCSPDKRKEWERELVCEVYYKQLVKSLKERSQSIIPCVEQVWEEYKQGGAGRWLWFICFLPQYLKPGQTQFFCDTVTAFLKDHFPGEEGAKRVGMPRV